MKIQLHLVAKDGNERDLPRWLMTDLSIFILSYSIDRQISWIQVNSYRENEHFLLSQLKF
jgi:hypothetical protein